MAQDKKLQKLELTWIGKDDPREAIEPRILIENPDYSYGTVETDTLPNGKPWNGNMLIHGDNLLALKALEENYTNAVKCIYIDPPYNTGSAFEHYDDNLEHSIWLSLIRERLIILYNLLSPDGSMWISLDDTEQAYCKVLCDEIFGRNNFVANVIWEKNIPHQMMQNGFPTVMILFLSMLKTKRLGVQIFYPDQKIWIVDTKIQITIQEVNGRQEIVP